MGLERFDEQSQAFQGPIESVPTIADIAARADEARTEGADHLTVSTDSREGYPTLVEIDWDANTIDEEECYRVSDYQADTGATIP